jgi:hypothetical protein
VTRQVTRQVERQVTWQVRGLGGVLIMATACSGSSSGQGPQFLGTWTGAATEIFSACSDPASDGTQSGQGMVTWALHDGTMTATNSAGCSFAFTYTEDSATLSPPGQTCSVSSASAGQSDLYTYGSYTWTYDAATATAQAMSSGTVVLSFGTRTVTCAFQESSRNVL